MKRASEVPPAVERAGSCPVISATAPATRSTNGPGWVKNTSEFEGSNSSRQRTFPAAASRQRASMRCLSVSCVWRSLKRILNRARLPGDQVHGSIADVDRSELQVRPSEMLGASIERLRHQGVHQRDEPADRIVRKLRGGDMPLLAGHDQHAVERTAPAD